MLIKKLSIRVASLGLFIFLLTCLAIKFHWYSSIWYFDMPMHFLGGFWIGLLLFWLFPLEKVSLGVCLKIILGVLLVGIFWEIFEILVDKSITLNPFNRLDTLSDLFFDLTGSIFAIFYFLKRILIAEKNNI